MPELTHTHTTPTTETPAAIESNGKPEKAKKKPVKKTAKAQTSSKPKSDLSKNQLLVLRILAKTGRPMTRPEIIKKSGPGKADSNGGWIVKPLGQWDAEVRKDHEEEEGKKSLISRGLVKAVRVPANESHPEERRYEITEKGQTALAK